MTLYETLAHQLMDDIKADKLTVGARLPALRTLAKQHQVSMTTATKTYDYLQQTGWIYAQPQSGYFVASQHINNPSQPSAFPMIRLDSFEQRDPKQFAPSNGYNPISKLFAPLGTSMIAPELQPSHELQRCIKRVTRRAGQQLFDYPNPQGEQNLRSALASHFLQEHFCFGADDLVITHGCIDAVRTAIETVTNEGDTIAIGSPCFSGLLDLLAGLSRHVIEIPVQEPGVDLAYFESVLQQGLVRASLFSTSNMNPTGLTLPVSQKQALAQLAAQYQIPMIEDDIYVELSHEKQSSLPAKHWDQQGYVLWCGSVSKTLAAGLRLGWCLPGRYLDGFLKKHIATGFGVNGLMQSALAEFINTGDYRSHVSKTRRLLSKQINQYRQFLVEHLPDTARVSLPQGGIVLWVRIPNLDAQALEQAALAEHIDMRSGACFSTHDFYHDCFRVNCGWPLSVAGEATDKVLESDRTYNQLKALSGLVNELV